MSGRARLTWCATLATLCAASALLPLVDPSVWVVQAVFLLVVQAVVGAGARRVPLARPVTVLAQVVADLLLLTLTFAHEQAVAGLLPTPEVFQRLGMLLEAGSTDVVRYATPAPLTDGIRLLLVGGVLLVGLAVDVLAVTCRRAAPAGLPLLALYSVAAGLSQNAADWLWFLLAASGYLLMLLAEGRDRLSRWGRVFGGGPRPAGAPAGTAAAGSAVAPVRTGRRIGVVALGLALVVPMALPTLDAGLLNASGAGRGLGSGDSISAVNPLVSLQNSLNQPDDRQVLSYHSTSAGAGFDEYLRIVALDEFDGTTWRPSVRRIREVPGVLPTPRGLGPDVRRTEVRTSIATADWYAQDWLPMPYPASRVQIAGRWRYEPVGRTLVGDHGQTTKGLQYEVVSLDVQPTAQQLAAAPPPPADLRRDFTEVPDSLPATVAVTARQVTHGARNDYERAVKLQDWFTTDGRFTYDTTVRSGTGSAAIGRFLHDREGFCVHFSFAMAAMARTLGVPARVAVGFTPGTAATADTMTVGLKDAHAWPELYFEGIGWTRFEPTPTRGSVPDYTLPQTPGEATSAPELPSHEPSAVPSGQPSQSASCTPQQTKLGACGSAAPQVVGGRPGGGPPLGLIVAGVLAGLLVLLVVLLPMLWRLRLRARRLGAPGRTAPELAARVLAAWHELRDTAWDHGIVPDAAETPRSAAERIIRVARLEGAGEAASGVESRAGTGAGRPSGAGAVAADGGAAAASARRLARAVEEVLYAPAPRPPAGLADDVRRVSAALGSWAGRGGRLRALLAPRSAVRLVWAGHRGRRAALRRLVRPFTRVRVRPARQE